MVLTNVFNRMFLKHLIESISKTCLHDGYENQLLLNVCKTVSGYKNIVKKCCLNILCVLFIKHFMMNV